MHAEPTQRSSGDDGAPLRVLVVAENASDRMGGEAVLPLHYFRELRRAGVEAWLITHERVAPELRESLGGDIEFVRFVEDTWLHRAAYRIGRMFPSQIELAWYALTLGTLTQIRLRRMAIELHRERGIDIVHQPTPVAPKAPSWIFGVGAPVVIGPMNGGMVYPGGFARLYESRLTAAAVRVLRGLSQALHVIVPGKLLATRLLVANERTRQALPLLARGRVTQIVENGILENEVGSTASAGNPLEKQDDASQREIQFLYVGRLVDWKGVDYLIRAVAAVREQTPCRLVIAGDGTERAMLERLVAELGLQSNVEFLGFTPRAECFALMRRSDVFVLSSLRECGGAVVLEAMANGLPVIATDWGGPADYLDASCGILVPPTEPERFVRDLAEAMTALAREPERRRALSEAGVRRVTTEFTWSKKIEDVLAVYSSVLGRELPALCEKS
ncbi:MAG: glycosyltransferase family 4 protein [Pirellulales bacterium]